MDTSVKRGCNILFMKKIQPFVRTISVVPLAAEPQKRMGFTILEPEDINAWFAKFPSVAGRVRLSRLATFAGFTNLSWVK